MKKNEKGQFIGRGEEVALEILKLEFGEDAEYKIQVPFIKWNDSEFIRISIQAYNNKKDIEKLLDALKNEYC